MIREAHAPLGAWVFFVKNLQGPEISVIFTLVKGRTNAYSHTEKMKC